MDFKPDDRKTTYRLFTQEKKTAPNIIFSVTALKWIHALIEAHSSEVGFYAVVDETKENTYYIRDIFYPKHDEANGGTCETSTEGETEIMEYLIEKNREDDIPKIRFWGHVHPQGFTSPSGQDETQAFERMNSTQSYLIRAICTDKEISISFFDYKDQIRFDNIKWTIEEGASNSALMIKLDKIKELVNQDYSNSAYNTIADVYGIFKEDQEYAMIEQKIKELKEKNIPKPRSYGSVHTYNATQQGNLFGHGHHGIVKQLAEDRNWNEDEDENTILDEKELASLMSDVNVQIEDFKKQTGAG